MLLCLSFPHPYASSGVHTFHFSLIYRHLPTALFLAWRQLTQNMSHGESEGQQQAIIDGPIGFNNIVK